MSRRLTMHWLPGLLWGLTLLVSAALLALVFLAPLWVDRVPTNAGWSQVVTLFARDATVRRTALASAIGLVVTGCVFFRPPGRLPERPTKRSERQPPTPIVGA